MRRVGGGVQRHAPGRLLQARLRPLGFRARRPCRGRYRPSSPRAFNCYFASKKRLFALLDVVCVLAAISGLGDFGLVEPTLSPVPIPKALIPFLPIIEIMLTTLFNKATAASLYDIDGVSSSRSTSAFTSSLQTRASPDAKPQEVHIASATSASPINIKWLQCKP
uniref:Uncharacterized protein n=1 Tax=Plectus sambesii TaxID=2011161 RepID=A0A914VAR5_9BILA